MNRKERRLREKRLREKQERNNKLKGNMNMRGFPKQLDTAFENVNEIMKAMTTEGQESLDILNNKYNKFSLTNFGMLLDMKNSKGDGFSVLVMDTNDRDVFRKRILSASEGIKENFPHLVGTQNSDYQGIPNIH